MITRILIALAASPLIFVAACEDAGGRDDSRADQAGKMAEQLSEQRLDEQGYGPLDQEIYSEIDEERYELIIDTQEINTRNATAGEEEMLGKP